MRDFLLVSKLLFKANYTVDFHTKKGRRTLLLGILLVLCMIPSMGLLFYVFHSAFQVASLNLLVIEFGFCAICFLIIWTALFVFPSIFYFSNDLPHLLVYPISPVVIVAAKFVVVYVSLFLTSCLGLIPLIFAFVLSGHAAISQIIFMILCAPFISLVPAFLTSIFWMILLRALPFFQNKDRFNLITGILSILIAVGIGVASSLFSNTSTENPAILLQMLQTNPEAFSILNNIFFHVPFAAHAIMENSVFSFLIYLALTCLCGFIFLFCAKHLYLISALSSKGTSSKRKAVKYKHTQSYPLWSYWKMDFYKLIRTPAYFSNCVLSSLVPPVMMVVIFLVLPDIKEASALLKSIDITQFINLPLYLYLGGMAVGFFFGSLNGISATAFSREGKNISFLLYIPFSFKQQIMVKCSLGVLFSLLSCVLLLIPVHMLLTYPLYYDLAYCIGCLITCVLVNQVSLIVDGLHPKTNWEDETSAIKNNINVFFEFLASWAILAVIVIPVFTTDIMNHLEIYTTFISVFFVILIVVFTLFIPKWIFNHLRKSH